MHYFTILFDFRCGHCKRLHPAWEDLAEKFNKKDGDKDVLIANIDCTVETALCSGN